jgi:hypothetical protein
MSTLPLIFKKYSINLSRIFTNDALHAIDCGLQSL